MYFLFPLTSCLSLSFILQVEEGWWEGVLNGKTGMFPSNFIKELSGESDDLGMSQDEQLSKSSKEGCHCSTWGALFHSLYPVPNECCWQSAQVIAMLCQLTGVK